MEVCKFSIGRKNNTWQYCQQKADYCFKIGISEIWLCEKHFEEVTKRLTGKGFSCGKRRKDEKQINKNSAKVN